MQDQYRICRFVCVLMYVCEGGRKYTSPSTILLQLVIMVDQLEKVGEGPCTRALHVDWERKDKKCNILQ